MRYPIALIAILSSYVLSGADWQPPKDEIFTEKQLTSYIAAQTELHAYQKAYGKAVEEAKGNAALALAAEYPKKLNAIIEKNGLQIEEYGWVLRKVGESLGAILGEDGSAARAKEFTEQRKKNADELAAAKTKFAAYEAASKTGTRVLTPERREELVKQFKDQETAALNEARTHTDEAKTAADEAAKTEADAKAAEALAQKPPADIDADSKPEYIKSKKEEAQNFRNSAKDVREKEKEARKAEAESKAKAAGFAKQAARPEVPLTDEDKEQLRNENAQGLESARAEVDAFKQAAQILADADAAGAKQLTEFRKTINEPNLALVKKHYKEVQKALGAEENK